MLVAIVPSKKKKMLVAIAKMSFIRFFPRIFKTFLYEFDLFV